MPRPRRTPSAPLLLVVALCLGACAPERSTFGPEKRRKEGRVFYLGGGSEPESIDPGKSYDGPGLDVARELFEGLTRYDPATLDPIPGLAERWEVEDEGRLYRFHLREARWSDGRPITAHDFEWSWKRVLDPQTAAQYAALFWDVVGGKAYNLGRGLREAVGVRALDDRTLEVRLERPVPWFLELTAFSPFHAVPRHAVETYGGDWTRPEHIVTSGPFHLRSWTPNYQIELVKSPTYWDRDAVWLEGAVFVVSDDNHAMLRLFRAGEIDWLGPSTRPPPEYLAHLRGKRDYQEANYLGSYFYWFNLREDRNAGAAFKDPRVRRALLLATDREALVEYVTKGGQRPADGIVPDIFFERGYPRPAPIPFDPEAARRLLAEAGYGPGGKPFPPIEILYNTHEAHRQVAEAIQAMWKRHLGIDVRIANQEWKVFMSNRLEGHFQLARAGWIGDFMDPYTFLSQFLSESEANEARWKNAEFDRLVLEATAERDPAKRYAMYARAEAILMEELPVLPIYYYSQQTLIAPWVEGFHPNARDIHPLRAIRLEEP
ncbi:MAG TPA: peptide ABC transporter substrate-binding protein [Fredinandcohnia sp.]|nr:peptide ABC transporter substrate-binding protein [Fredinandcohnia sp.]